jgi:hypothetical protein
MQELTGPHETHTASDEAPSPQRRLMSTLTNGGLIHRMRSSEIAVHRGFGPFRDEVSAVVLKSGSFKQKARCPHRFPEGRMLSRLSRHYGASV